MIMPPELKDKVLQKITWKLENTLLTMMINLGLFSLFRWKKSKIATPINDQLS
jgi:hypothetical protein